MNGTEFQMRVWRVMEDQDLCSLEKLVMIAYYLYEGNPSQARIAAGTSLSPEALNIVERDLMRKDWLASPLG